MSVDYHVAVHAADWPTTAALNQCLSKLHYPLNIKPASKADLDKPLAAAPYTLGLVTEFEGKSIELETSITKLGPKSPYAFGLRADLPKTEGTLADGTKYIIQSPSGQNDFVPKDLNTDLKRIGYKAPDYKNGDYVITLSFRSSIPEYRAGAFLMAGLIKCSNGLGFEFQSGTFGTGDYADSLAQEAASPKNWK